MEDPRDVHSDDELAKLTDEERIESEDSEDEYFNSAVEEQLRELEKRKLELEEKKRKKAELKAKRKVEPDIKKSPSPLKSRKLNDSSSDMRPRSLTQQLKEVNRSDDFESNSHDGSTSYFVKMLEESHNHDQSERDEAKRLMSSRIYTFDKDLLCEPFAVNEKEYYSGKNISKRYLKPDDLSAFFADKKVMRLPKLFAKVAPPTFDEPRYPNWVVVGIICKKSVPKGTRDNKSKYITMTLTDFNMTIDVHIFGTAVEKYVKLRLGDIIAILNPEIFIWKPDSKGIIRSFSLSIKHSFECILEIGKARDFGLCQSLKRDGTVCGTPIDTSREDCCLFHKELRIRKTQGKRMELNGGFNLRSPTKNGTKQQFLMGGKDSKGEYSNSTIADDRYAPKVDRVSKSLVYFSNPHAGRAFFDDSYQNPDILKNIEEKKRKIQERKKESELKAKLLRLGQKPVVEKPSITKEEIAEIRRKKALLRTAFKGDTLQNIGYDPTSKPNTKGVLDSDEVSARNETVLDELSSLAQNKNINLGISKEEMVKRKEQRHQAAILIKRIRERDQTAKEKETSKKESSVRKDVELDSGSDSDSDLEIETGNITDAYKKFKLSQTKEVDP